MFLVIFSSCTHVQAGKYLTGEAGAKFITSADSNNIHVIKIKYGVSHDIRNMAPGYVLGLGRSPKT